ncbi:hypothetical protein MTBPR1_220010 [Candidatus Terasakiella magnetica]|uniref:Uncharacterized protein n=1 Tax=Candidatus Terasakiella magnetica TaxID=1867952 RepID=A0A1C3RH12_9PROT|nr:hypothetical protein MTBPR1_220010 [Candidatus Terasakiella magnetica]
MTYFVKENHASTTASISTAALSIKLQDAKEAMIGMNNAVIAIINGQHAVSHDAMTKAYDFVVDCLNDEYAANDLDGYMDIKVGANSVAAIGHSNICWNKPNLKRLKVTTTPWIVMPQRTAVQSGSKFSKMLMKKASRSKISQRCSLPTTVFALGTTPSLVPKKSRI